MFSHKRILVVFLLGLVIASTGCQKRALSEQQQFQLLFEGYQLELVDDLPVSGVENRTTSPTLRSTYPLESKFIPQRVYVFRKENDEQEDVIGLKVLPRRLSEIGARITQSPKSANDFLYVYDGGPFFTIKFEKDGHTGEILNSFNPAEKNKSAWEELVFAYK